MHPPKALALIRLWVDRAPWSRGEQLQPPLPNVELRIRVQGIAICALERPGQRQWGCRRDPRVIRYGWRTTRPGALVSFRWFLNRTGNRSGCGAAGWRAVWVWRWGR